jgi:hypothetical protein
MDLLISIRLTRNDALLLKGWLYGLSGKSSLNEVFGPAI